MAVVVIAIVQIRKCVHKLAGEAKVKIPNFPKETQSVENHCVSERFEINGEKFIFSFKCCPALKKEEEKSAKDILLGNKIKSLRDEQGILQRQVAACLEIDTPMFSKIERGDRRAKRSQVPQLAEYFHVDEKELLTLWLADRILDAIEGEKELQFRAIEVAKRELTKADL